MRTKWPGLLGHLSRMLMVMFDSGREDPGDFGTAPRGTVSLTNRHPASQRHGLNLPGRESRTHPGRSLSNILTARPAAHRGRMHPSAEDMSSAREEALTVSEAVRFYRIFLAGMLERQPDVRGVRLNAEMGIAIEEARALLPGEAGTLLPDMSSLSEPAKSFDAPEPSLARPGIDGPDIETIRRAYLTVLQRILARLSARMDPTVVKLIFRLAAKNAQRDRMALVDRYSLLEGIAENFLRQVGS